MEKVFAVTEYVAYESPYTVKLFLTEEKANLFVAQELLNEPDYYNDDRKLLVDQIDVE